MSCLSRRVVENRIKKQQARENGNTNALVGLMVIGCLLFAGHAFATQVGRFKHSLKDVFRSLSDRKTITNAGKNMAKQLAKDEWQQMAEGITKAMDEDER